MQSQEAGKCRHSRPPLLLVFPFLNFIMWARMIRRLTAALVSFYSFSKYLESQNFPISSWVILGKFLATKICLHLYNKVNDLCSASLIGHAQMRKCIPRLSKLKSPTGITVILIIRPNPLVF